MLNLVPPLYTLSFSRLGCCRVSKSLYFPIHMVSDLSVPLNNYMLVIVQHVHCLDVDMLFHNHWGAEVLSTLVAAIHPGYYKNPREVFPYERRPASQAYVPLDQGDFYYAGAMIGGLIENVRALTRTCHQAILIDKLNDIEAVWQEESHLNKYFLQHKPTKLLSPEYLWDDTKPKPPEDPLHSLLNRVQKLRRGLGECLDKGHVSDDVGLSIIVEHLGTDLKYHSALK